MNNGSKMVAAAVAAAISSLAFSAQSQAAAPTLAAIQGNTTNVLVMAGSSAAEPAVASAFAADACGGAANMTTLQSSAPSGGSGSGNFFAFACTTTKALGTLPAGTLVTIYYRDEGGSVVGALPIAAAPAGQVSHKIQRLDPTKCTGTAAPYTCTVSGLTANDGPNDAWAGAVVEDYVQLGLTDVEPGLLTGNDYPTLYNASAFGTATAAQLAGLPIQPAVDQVFGVYVNNTGAGMPATINLTQQTVNNIFSAGAYTDWNQVPDAVTGNPIVKPPASVPILIVNREAGSGTRTAMNTFFFNYQCGSTTSIGLDPGPDNYSTSDEMTAIGKTAGAIGYASINNSKANVVLATLNGIVPSNLAAATGEYPFWYEAQFVTTSAGGAAGQIASYLEGVVPEITYVPQLADILATPGAGATANTAAVPVSGSANGVVYVNPFSRSQNSCNTPTELSH